VQNLNPPFAELLPPYYLQNNDVWNRHMTDFVQGTAFGAHFASFEGFAILTPIYYSGGVSECDASMGLGFCVLLAATAVLGLKRKSAIPAASSSLGRRVLTPLLMAPWVVLVVFLAKVGASENARHLAPYYPFLLLLPFSGRVAAAAARSRLWQKTGLLTMAFAAFLVVTQAPRPLFPAQTWFGRLQQAYPRNWFIYGECFIYNLNGPRNLAAQRQWIASHIPPEEKTIGYVPVPFGCDEPALWLAYPGINVQSLTLRESPESLARQGVHYAFLAHDGFWARRAIPFDDFFTHYHATVVASANIAFDNASNCPSNIRTNLPRIFYVVRFDPATNSTATTARIPGQTD
jgi:hypothetical protein